MLPFQRVPALLFPPEYDLTTPRKSANVVNMFARRMLLVILFSSVAQNIMYMRAVEKDNKA